MMAGMTHFLFDGKYLAKSFPVFSIIRRYPKIYGQVLKILKAEGGESNLKHISGPLGPD